MLMPAAAEEVIAEACALMLAPHFQSVNVIVEDGWTVSPLVIITVKLRFWQWLWFEPTDFEVRVQSFLNLVARGRYYRVRVEAE